MIEWSMRLFDNDQEIVARRKHIGNLKFYDGYPGLFAVHRARDWFSHKICRWDEWFGMDAGDGEVIVEIHEPEAMRGKWRVGVELTVEANSAVKLQEAKTP